MPSRSRAALCVNIDRDVQFGYLTAQSGAHIGDGARSPLAQRWYDALARVDALPEDGLMPLASLTLAEEEPILIRPGRTVAGQYDADSLADVLAQLEQQWSAEQPGKLTVGTDAPAAAL